MTVRLAQPPKKAVTKSAKPSVAEQNVSLLKSGKVKGVRFETLEKICETLQCQPGDILEYRAEEFDSRTASRERSA
jgi:putative transcriptional regulator